MAINDDDDGQAHFTSVKEVEYLGLWTAKVDEQPAVVFSVRLDTDSFSVTNLSLTASQAKRLAIDLASHFLQSDLLENSEPDPELRVAFDRITESNDS